MVAVLKHKIKKAMRKAMVAHNAKTAESAALAHFYALIRDTAGPTSWDQVDHANQQCAAAFAAARRAFTAMQTAAQECKQVCQNVDDQQHRAVTADQTMCILKLRLDCWLCYNKAMNSVWLYAYM
jgi:hypothetical protein